MPRRSPRAWTTGEDHIVLVGYADGETLGELAESLRCDLSQVASRVVALRRAGHDLPARKPRWTPKARDRLARRYREGASLRQLEREFERTRGTITKQLAQLKRLGHDLSRPGPDGVIREYGEMTQPGPRVSDQWRAIAVGRLTVANWSDIPPES